MKTKTLALAAVLALAAAAPAHAFTPGGTFVLSGPVTFGSGPLTIPCVAYLQVDSTNTKILSATFTAGSAICSSIYATGLPWPVSQNVVTPAVTINMAVVLPTSACPSTPVTGAWNNTAPGTMSVPNTVFSSTCRISSATLSANPAQTLP